MVVHLMLINMINMITLTLWSIMYLRVHTSACDARHCLWRWGSVSTVACHLLSASWYWIDWCQSVYWGLGLTLLKACKAGQPPPPMSVWFPSKVYLVLASSNADVRQGLIICLPGALYPPHLDDLVTRGMAILLMTKVKLRVEGKKWGFQVFDKRENDFWFRDLNDQQHCASLRKERVFFIY